MLTRFSFRKGFWDLITRKEITSKTDYPARVELALQRLAIVTLYSLQEKVHGGIRSSTDLKKENLAHAIDAALNLSLPI